MNPLEEEARSVGESRGVAKLSISLEAGLYERLKEEARRQHRSVSNLVEVFILDYAARHHPELLHDGQE